jgi:uncharacterized protein YqjF (DUF2071 family)
MVMALHMEWRHVLFANWPVDPELLVDHVPAALSLDTYDGDAWLSVVPFKNVDVRPTWLPAGWGYPLPELNLRTYVTHNGHDGVYFFSLDAQGIVSVIGARLFHHLPYYYARCSVTDENGDIRFQSRRLHPGARPVHFDGTYSPTGSELEVPAGSLEAFLTARYRYYTEAPDGSVRYSTVDHTSWPLYDTDPEIRTNTLFEANGFSHPERNPVHFYSPGVRTIASPNRRV